MFKGEEKKEKKIRRKNRFADGESMASPARLQGIKERAVRAESKPFLDRSASMQSKVHNACKRT